MIEGRFKRSAFHGWLGFLKAEARCRELQGLLHRRLQAADNSVEEAKLIIRDLRNQGHRLELSEADSESDLQVWVDEAFAVWFWADSPPKDVTKHIDRIEVFWQRM